MENLSSTKNNTSDRKLLICTQAIDANDDVMGFFCGWVREFAEVFSTLTVIALKTGKRDVPTQVKVFSLGKEIKKSRIRYVLNFYKYILRERSNYDAVLVHMNKEYVLLGGLVWRLLGKKIILWYNHPLGTFSARLAARLAHQVCYTSPESFFGRQGIGRQMPVGIDTDVFSMDNRLPSGHTVLSLGRIAPIKNTLASAQAVVDLSEKGVRVNLILVGTALARDAEYQNQVDALTQRHTDIITVVKGVPNHTAPQLYASAQVFVNLTKSGSLDKALFEAMSAGCVVVTSNKYVASLLPDNHREALFVPENDIHAAAKSIEYALTLNEIERANLVNYMRAVVVEHHSLKRLVNDVRDVIDALY